LQRDFVVIPLLDLDTELKVNGQSLQNLELVQHSTLTVLADQSWAG
jgi:7,8-dihydro-6-hydroxymethylpterin-pyrophosphokinase